MIDSWWQSIHYKVLWKSKSECLVHVWGKILWISDFCMAAICAATTTCLPSGWSMVNIRNTSTFFGWCYTNLSGGKFKFVKAISNFCSIPFYNSIISYKVNEHASFKYLPSLIVKKTLRLIRTGFFSMIRHHMTCLHILFGYRA